MSFVGVAAYKPEMFFITLKKEFSGSVDSDNPLVLETPEQAAIFLHEWIHYIHNTSTVLGLATFCQMVVIWSNFRWSFGVDGWSGGKQVLSEQSAADIERQWLQMQILRGKSNNRNSSGLKSDLLNFEAAELVVAFEDENCRLHKIKCVAKYGRPGETLDVYEFAIGVHEIIEGVGYLLEDRAATIMGTIIQLPRVDPYLLVSKLSGLIAPSLGREEIICAMIASLQSHDAPNALYYLLITAERAISNGDNPAQAIRGLGRELLNDALPNCDRTLSIVEEIFPVEEPMARFVKDVVSSIKENLSVRKADLFFELSIIDGIKDGFKIIDDSIRAFGPPIFILEKPSRDARPDEDAKFRSNLIYEVKMNAPNHENIVNGWYVMCSAFNFVAAHFSGGKLRDTSSSSGECIYYNTCDLEFRKLNPGICQEKPWLSLIDNPCNCMYSLAVQHTRPPAK